MFRAAGVVAATTRPRHAFAPLQSDSDYYDYECGSRSRRFVAIFADLRGFLVLTINFFPPPPPIRAPASTVPSATDTASDARAHLVLHRGHAVLVRKIHALVYVYI